MRDHIDAVAFDIDGTLYPDYALYPLILPFILRNSTFMKQFAAVRKEIRIWQDAHPGEKKDDFFIFQAELFAKKADMSVSQAKDMIHEKIYEGWKPLFRKIRPFPYLHETFSALKKSGLKIGLMSDFLPSQKETVWGLDVFCDVMLGSEETGALKPSPIPFLALSTALKTPLERILYVGNSIPSDIIGASGVGMKCACLIPSVLYTLGHRVPMADISFASYRQLLKNVLN